MNIYVLGGCGYIGARLVPFLLADGHKVTVSDIQYFGDGDPCHNDSLTVLKEDIREGTWPVKGMDAVIHLASISNNDMYARNREQTRFVNTIVPASSCYERYIYASSVVAYGPSDDVLTEDSPLKPITPYGEDKAYCDEAVLKHGGTSVRAASVCGHSPNMRFDTPINSMTRAAMNNKPIQCNGGMQIRSHIAIDDLCALYRLLLTAPIEKVRGKAFNAVEQHMTMKTTARFIGKLLDAPVEYNPSTDKTKYMMAGWNALEILDWRPSSTSILKSIEMMRAHNTPQYRDFSDARMRLL